MSKNPKISINLKKSLFSQKIIFFVKYLFRATKKNKKNKSPFFNIRTIQFDQSSPVQPNPEKKNVEKSQKISKNHFFCHKKKLDAERKKSRKQTKCHSLCFSRLWGHDWTRAFQSSPFQNPGGEAKRYGQRTNERTEFLVSNIEYKVPWCLTWSIS